MTWSYSGNPGTSHRDRIRFLIGDKVQTAQSLSDAELDYLLDEAPSPELAAAAAAEQMADAYSGLSVTSKRVGDLSLSMDYGRTGAKFTATARRLRQRYFTLGAPLMGDTSEKVFRVGQMDYAEPRNVYGVTGNGS
ncbi:hypothetical protein SALGADO_31 [Arthrobacter phage Salgado]|uniref:Uncharacterized protein n=1 Tax=Arthrobacter phage Salgado TaxID=1772314 RepID=A0A0U4IXL1_9CAUD|nr:hypothetical protein KMD22_gp31 [Arthrobacter phage Salgado]ALY10199.1 hypothetical protein SALGADO_31 [Arthrobacter phage Salgado]